jgi:tetratricopeptide (TPR) repeat protein
MDNCWQQAFVNRGIAYRSLGMDSRALDDFNEAISRVPDGLAFFNRGALYYFNFSDTLSACRDWQKAKEAGFAGADEVLLKYCK